RRILVDAPVDPAGAPDPIADIIDGPDRDEWRLGTTVTFTTPPHSRAAARAHGLPRTAPERLDGHRHWRRVSRVLPRPGTGPRHLRPDRAKPPEPRRPSGAGANDG